MLKVMLIVDFQSALVDFNPKLPPFQQNADVLGCRLRTVNVNRSEAFSLRNPYQVDSDILSI